MVVTSSSPWLRSAGLWERRGTFRGPGAVGQEEDGRVTSEVTVLPEVEQQPSTKFIQSRA